jgi:hypothetical protein
MLTSKARETPRSKRHSECDSSTEALDFHHCDAGTIAQERGVGKEWRPIGVVVRQVLRTLPMIRAGT